MLIVDIKRMTPIFPKDKKDKKTEEKESEQNDEQEEDDDGEEEKGTATRATTRLASRLEAERYFNSSGTQRSPDNRLY